MSRALARSPLRRRRGQLLIGAAIGTGIAANFAMRGGADFLLALNAGRLRSMGEPSVTSMTALNEANAFTFDFASREILPRATVPVIFGACCFDPRQDPGELVARVRKAGFAGISNFPTATMLTGPMRAMLERLGLGFRRELAMLVMARSEGLVTLAYTHSLAEAEEAAALGADLITIGLGWNHGGALGSPDPPVGQRAIEEVAIHVDRTARAVAAISPDTICLVEGGPIVSPRHLEELCRFVNIGGYIGGSTIDRVPIESAIEDTTAAFKTIGASRGDAAQGRPIFPLQLVGRSEAIRQTRDRLLRLAGTDLPVNLVLPQGVAQAGRIIDTLHGLSRRRRKELQVVHIGPDTWRDRLVDLFGQAAGAAEADPGKPGPDRARIGILELLSGGTLGIVCAGGTPNSVLRDIAEAVRRGRGQQIGGTRGFDFDIRVVIASVTPPEALAGFATLAVPPLSQRQEDVSSVLDIVLRSLRSQLRRPLLRLDAAAWRLMVDHGWPGDVEELRRTVEAAALSIDGDVITPMELPHLREAKGGDSLFASEKDWILDGLRRNRFKRSETAQYLGISRKTLYNKIRRYALDREPKGP
jgi:predicted TIM-barrel enzyme/transcriptional regulator with AAA-type ATPase domain